MANMLSSVESQIPWNGMKDKSQSQSSSDEQLGENSLGSLPSSNGQSHDFVLKEAKISELLDQLVNTKRELEKVNEKCENYEHENSNLKLQVEELTAQFNQHEHLELKTCKDEESTRLKNKLNQSIKDMNKSNLILGACRSQVATKTTLLKKMEIHIKHLWNYLVEFGNVLASADLLESHQKDALLKTCEEYFTLHINQNESETDIYKVLNDLSTTTTVSSMANINFQKTTNENEDVDNLVVENSPPIFTSLSNETSSEDRSPVKFSNTSNDDQIKRHETGKKNLSQEKYSLCSDIPSSHPEASFANIQMSFSIAPFIGQEFLNTDSSKESSNNVEDNTLVSNYALCRVLKSQGNGPMLGSAVDESSSEIIHPTSEVSPNEPLTNFMDLNDEQSKQTALGNADPRIMDNSVHSVTKTLLQDLYLSEDSVDNPVIANRFSHHVCLERRSPVKKINSVLHLVSNSKEDNPKSYNLKNSSGDLSSTIVNEKELRQDFDDPSSTLVSENELGQELFVQSTLSAPTVDFPSIITPTPTVLLPLKEQIKAKKLTTPRSGKKTNVDNQISIIKKALSLTKVCNAHEPFEGNSMCKKRDGLTSSIYTSTPLRRCLDFQLSASTPNLNYTPKLPNSKNHESNFEESPSISNKNILELDKHSITSCESHKSLINNYTSFNSLNEFSDDSDTNKKLQNITINSDIKSKTAALDVYNPNEESINSDAILNERQNELCMLTAKKCNDGSVKFGFNLAKPCTITLDPNNYNISCIFNQTEEDSQCSVLPSLNNSRSSPALLSSSSSVFNRQDYDANLSPDRDRRKLYANKLLSPVSMNENVVKSSSDTSFSTIHDWHNPELVSELNVIAETPPSTDMHVTGLNPKQLKDKVVGEDMFSSEKIRNATIVSPKTNNINSTGSFVDKSSNAKNSIELSPKKSSFEQIYKNTFPEDNGVLNITPEDTEADALPSILGRNVQEENNNLSYRHLRSGLKKFNLEEPSSKKAAVPRRIASLLSIQKRISSKKTDKKKSLSYKKKRTYESESLDSDESCSWDSKSNCSDSECNFLDSKSNSSDSKSNSSDSGEWSLVKVDADEESNNTCSFEDILAKHVKEVESMYQNQSKLKISDENELQSNAADKSRNEDLVSSVAQPAVEGLDLKFNKIKGDVECFEDPTVNVKPYALFGTSLLDEDAPLHSLDPEPRDAPLDPEPRDAPLHSLDPEPRDAPLHSLDPEPVKVPKYSKNIAQNKMTYVRKKSESEHDNAFSKGNCSKSSDDSLQLSGTNFHLVEELTDHVSPTPQTFQNVMSKHIKESTENLKINHSILNEAVPSPAEVRNIAEDEGNTVSTNIESVVKKTPVVSSNVSKPFDTTFIKHIKKTNLSTLNEATSFAGVLVNNHNTTSDKSNSDSTNSVLAGANISLVTSEVSSSFEEVLAKHMKATGQNTLNDVTPSERELLNNHDAVLHEADIDTTGISFAPEDTGTHTVSSKLRSSFVEVLEKHMKETGQNILNDETPSVEGLLNNHDSVLHEGNTDTANIGSTSNDMDTPVVSNKVPISFEEILTKHMEEEDLMIKRPSSPNFTELKKNLLNASFEDILAAHIEDVKILKGNKKPQSIQTGKNNTSAANETSLDLEINYSDSQSSENNLIIDESCSSNSPTKLGVVNLLNSPSSNNAINVQNSNSLINVSEKCNNHFVTLDGVASSDNTLLQFPSETNNLMDCNQILPESITINSDVVPKEVEQINGSMPLNANNDKKFYSSCNLKTSIKSIEDGEIKKGIFYDTKPTTPEHHIVKSNGGNICKSFKTIRVVLPSSKLPAVWVKRSKECNAKDCATESLDEVKTKHGSFGNCSFEAFRNVKDHSAVIKKVDAIPFIMKNCIKKLEKKQLTSILPDYISKAGGKGSSLIKFRFNVPNNNSGHLIESEPCTTKSNRSTLCDSGIEKCTKSALSSLIKPCSVVLEKIEPVLNKSNSDLLHNNDGPLKSEINKSYLKKSTSQKTSHLSNEIKKSFNKELKIPTIETSSSCGNEQNSDTEQTSMHVKEIASTFNEEKSLSKEGVKTSPRKGKHSTLDVENYADTQQESDISKVQCNEILMENKSKRKRKNSEEINLEANKKIKLRESPVSLDPLSELSQCSDTEQSNLHNITSVDNRRTAENVPIRKKNIMRKRKIIGTGNSIKRRKTKGNVFYMSQISTYSKSRPKCIQTSENSLNEEICSRSKVKTIQDYFQFIKVKQLEDTNFKTSAHSLKIVLSDPENYPDIPSLLFNVIKYLSHSEENPMLAFLENEEASILLPPEEDSIITALFLIESERIPHLKGILKITVNKIQHLISKKTINNYGLASLCRVVTEISKRKGDNFAPLFLCSTLLKMKHQFAPYLIASVAGIWKELFLVEDGLTDEEIIFHSAIAYGANKKTIMADAYWNASKKIIGKYFNYRSVVDVQKSIRILMNIIQINCFDNSWTHIDNLTSALVIFAVHEDWKWTKEHVLNSYVLRNLDRFGNDDINEKAFDLFCSLYVDIFLVNPSPNPQEEVLVQFFKDDKVSKGCSPIQESAALALMKLSYLKKIMLPNVIKNWFETNQNDPKVLKIKGLFKSG